MPFAQVKMEVQKGNVSRSGSQTIYHFKLQMISGTAHNAKVELFSSYRSIATDAGMGYSPSEVIPFGSLTAPNYRNAFVNCMPPPGAYCSAAFVQATANGGISEWGTNEADGFKIP